MARADAAHIVLDDADAAVEAGLAQALEDLLGAVYGWASSQRTIWPLKASSLLWRGAPARARNCCAPAHLATVPPARSGTGSWGHRSSTSRTHYLLTTGQLRDNSFAPDSR